MLLRLVLIGRHSAPAVGRVVELGGPRTLAHGAGGSYEGVTTVKGGCLASGTRD